MGSEVHRIDIDGDLPLATWITSRMGTLSQSKADLARRMGYQATVEKGVRRVDALLGGDLKKYGNLRRALAAALDVDLAALDKVVADTRYVLWARDDREYRRVFSPHAIWDTEFRVPRPLLLAGMAGLQRALYFHPTSADPADWSEEATANCPPGIPCYGVVRGFWVNYTPDCAVYFNRNGEPGEVLGKAVRPGVPSASIGSRPVNLAELSQQRSQSLGKVDWTLL